MQIELKTSTPSPSADNLPVVSAIDPSDSSNGTRLNSWNLIPEPTAHHERAEALTGTFDPGFSVTFLFSGDGGAVRAFPFGAFLQSR